MSLTFEDVEYDDRGLIPAIVQDAETGDQVETVCGQGNAAVGRWLDVCRGHAVYGIAPKGVGRVDDGDRLHPREDR